MINYKLFIENKRETKIKYLVEQSSFVFIALKYKKKSINDPINYV